MPWSSRPFLKFMHFLTIVTPFNSIKICRGQSKHEARTRQPDVRVGQLASKQRAMQSCMLSSVSQLLLYTKENPSHRRKSLCYRVC